MRAGDAHGPDRIFDVQVAFDGDATPRLKMRSDRRLGAYAGRSPFQLANR